MAGGRKKAGPNPERNSTREAKNFRPANGLRKAVEDQETGTSDARSAEARHNRTLRPCKKWKTQPLLKSCRFQKLGEREAAVEEMEKSLSAHQRRNSQE